MEVFKTAKLPKKKKIVFESGWKFEMTQFLLTYPRLIYDPIWHTESSIFSSMQKHTLKVTLFSAYQKP